MATSRGVLAEERVVFDCPKCGVRHDGPLTVEVENEVMDREVGPPVEAISVIARTTFRTSACGDVFVTCSIADEPTYEVSMVRFADDRPTQLHVTPKHEEGGDGDAA